MGEQSSLLCNYANVICFCFFFFFFLREILIFLDSVLSFYIVYEGIKLLTSMSTSNNDVQANRRCNERQIFIEKIFFSFVF